MATGVPVQRFVAVLLVATGALLTACGTLIGFPDRILDDADTDAGAAEAGDPNAIADGPTDTKPIYTGPARASLSTTVVDFGLVSCGAQAPPAKLVTITNVGAEPLTWGAVLAPTPDFSISGASAGTIASGMFETVTIASTAVRALSGAGDTAQGVLTITTNDVQSPFTAVSIKRTAAGGSLSVVPLTAAFGETPANVAAQSIPIALKNTGNQAVMIGFGTPTPPAVGFTLAWTGAPAAVSVPPGAAVPALLAGFKPTTIASFTSTSAINVTGPLCGTNPISLTFTGDGTSSTASVQPGSLDFGLVDCGTTAAAKKVKIINSGATAFHWDAALTAGLHYALSASSGDIAAASFAEVTVTPNMIPSTSAISPNLYGDTLTITTDAPGDTDPHQVDLLMTAHGAIVDQSAGSIDFGSVGISSPATSNFTVSNAGNAPATVSYGTNPAVFTVSPQAQVVGAGASYVATARFAPTAQQLYSGTAQMSVPAGTVLCAPLKPAIAFSGQGALGAQVTPSSLDFGLVSCGSAGAAKTLTLVNTSPASFTWIASISTAYYEVSPASGTIGAGASAPITVTPKAIPSVSSTAADLYAATLTFQTTPALESPYVASLHMTAEGAILSFNPTGLDFGGVRKYNSKTKSYAVVNAGNLAAPITLTKSGFRYSISPTSATVNAGSSATLNATFSPTSTGTSTGSVSVDTSANRCAPLPAALTLTGSGT